MDAVLGAALTPRMGFRRSLVRIQSPRHLRLVVTTGYGKPFSFTFSGPGTLWALIEPEICSKITSSCHHIQFERSLPVTLRLFLKTQSLHYL